MFLQAQEILEKRKQRYDPTTCCGCSTAYRSAAWCGRGCCGWMTDAFASNRDSSVRSPSFQNLLTANAGRLARTFTNRSAVTFPSDGVLGLLGARPEVDGFDPAGGSDPARLRILLADPPRPSAGHRHDARRAAVRAGRLQHPWLSSRCRGSGRIPNAMCCTSCVVRQRELFGRTDLPNLLPQTQASRLTKADHHGTSL